MVSAAVALLFADFFLELQFQAALAAQMAPSGRCVQFTATD